MLDDQSSHERRSHSNKLSKHFCSLISNPLVFLPLQTTLVARETKWEIQGERNPVYEPSDAVTQKGDNRRGRTPWVDMENWMKGCQRARRVTLQVREEDRDEWIGLQSTSGRKEVTTERRQVM